MFVLFWHVWLESLDPQLQAGPSWAQAAHHSYCNFFYFFLFFSCIPTFVDLFSQIRIYFYFLKKLFAINQKCDVCGVWSQAIFNSWDFFQHFGMVCVHVLWMCLTLRKMTNIYQLILQFLLQIVSSNAHCNIYLYLQFCKNLLHVLNPTFCDLRLASNYLFAAFGVWLTCFFPSHLLKWKIGSECLSVGLVSRQWMIVHTDETEIAVKGSCCVWKMLKVGWFSSHQCRRGWE